MVLKEHVYMIDQVELLLRVHHVNLVGLVGYCFEENHLALVYEYTASGDLKQHLSGKISYLFFCFVYLNLKTSF